MRFYPSILLHAIVIEAAFDIASDEKFQAFNESEFGQNAIQSIVETEIADFYTDLSFSIESFSDFDERLTFVRSVASFPWFRYKPDAPVYHLKQNQQIQLPSSVLDLVLKKESGNCTGFLYNASHAERYIQERPAGFISFFTHGYNTEWIWIPDGCLLYVYQIERFRMLELHSNVLARQVKFSNLNGQRPQLQGLESNEILNLNPCNYFEKLDQENVPRLSPQSYSDGIAVFGSTSSLVIPQDYEFHLPRSSVFDLDTLHFVVQPLNCPDLSFLDPFVTANGGEDNGIEIQVERHQADVFIRTPVGCELNVTSISRHIGLSLHSEARRIIQHGLPRGDVYTISLTSNDLFLI